MSLHARTANNLATASATGPVTLYSFIEIFFNSKSFKKICASVKRPVPSSNLCHVYSSDEWQAIFASFSYWASNSRWFQGDRCFNQKVSNQTPHHPNCVSVHQQPKLVDNFSWGKRQCFLANKNPKNHSKRGKGTRSMIQLLINSTVEITIHNAQRAGNEPVNTI